jgi:hypothetical protein
LPVKTAIDPMKMALFSGCVIAVVGALLTLLVDPTKGLQDRLDALPEAHGLSLPLAKKEQVAIAGLADRPIFVMTTGPGAYKDKSLELFGLAISPGRKAALVSVDGAAAVWMAVGDAAGDIRLADVGTNGASFETPIGSRTVRLSDAAPAKSGASSASASSSQPPQGG